MPPRHLLSKKSKGTHTPNPLKTTSNAALRRANPPPRKPKPEKRTYIPDPPNLPDPETLPDPPEEFVAFWARSWRPSEDAEENEDEEGDEEDEEDEDEDEEGESDEDPEDPEEASRAKAAKQAAQEKHTHRLNLRVQYQRYKYIERVLAGLEEVPEEQEEEENEEEEGKGKGKSARVKRDSKEAVGKERWMRQNRVQEESVGRERRRERGLKVMRRMEVEVEMGMGMGEDGFS